MSLTGQIPWLAGRFRPILAFIGLLAQVGCSDAEGGRSISGSAPSTEEGGSGSIALELAFPNLAFSQLVGAYQPPSDDSRWFVIERAGRIRSFANAKDAATAQTVLDITAKVSTVGEGGLLGLAFHPNFSIPGSTGEKHVFISYTGPSSPLRTVISRFTYLPATGTLNPASEFMVLTEEQPYSNHNGGHIAFGPDGHLYIGLGDGGGSGDPEGNGQDIATRLGAMLRVDVDGGSPYAIPPGNPFAARAGADEIYAYGLRNPWRWSFDRATGDLWLGDVGENKWEEVDRIERGGNYGWNIMEGGDCFQSSCDPSAFAAPVGEYSHDDGCSITGGYVYRGGKIGFLAGQYLFADFCAGSVSGLDIESGAVELLLDTDMSIVSFAESLVGELCLLDFATGTIHWIIKG